MPAMGLYGIRVPLAILVHNSLAFEILFLKEMLILNVNFNSK